MKQMRTPDIEPVSQQEPANNGFEPFHKSDNPEEKPLIPDRFLKTQICRHWLKGRCNKPDCRYAHGQQDLKKFEPKAKGLLYKTEMCEKWKNNGECKYGNRCRFAHGESDLRKTPDLKDSNIRRILQLEKENNYLRGQIREMERALGVESRSPRQIHRIVRSPPLRHPLQLSMPQPQHIQQLQQPSHNFSQMMQHGQAPQQLRLPHQIQQIPIPNLAQSIPQHSQNHNPINSVQRQHSQQQLQKSEEIQRQQALLIKLLPLLQQQQSLIKPNRKSNSHNSSQRRRRRRSRTRSHSHQRSSSEDSFDSY